MQCGVQMLLDRAEATGAPTPKDCTPKHLRAGVNSALVDSGAIAGLLVAKGLITEDELWTALADGAEREHQKYEAELSTLLGRKVRLA